MEFPTLLRDMAPPNVLACPPRDIEASEPRRVLQRRHSVTLADVRDLPALLVVARHAEGTRNAAKAGQVFFLDPEARRGLEGEADRHAGPTGTGREQAFALGERMMREFGTFDLVCHSGYRRTRETVELVLKAMGQTAAPVVRESLRRDEEPARFSLAALLAPARRRVRRWRSRDAVRAGCHLAEPGCVTTDNDVTRPGSDTIIGDTMVENRQPKSVRPPSLVALSLEAVIVAVTDERPRLLVSLDDPRRPSIPSGPLDASDDATLERALRRWVRHRAGLELGYAEQLYTFGDRDRRPDVADRLLSVAYLALVREEQPSPGAAWIDCYDFFPWEDHRHGRPAMLDARVLPGLERWVGRNGLRQARVREAFGVPPMPWDAIRVLERYELLYEAGLIAEHYADKDRVPPDGLGTGTPLAYDHRRIAASALARLRGKLTYRPVVFELLPETFTLTQLQRTVEALVGLRTHKQNFRRLVEQGRLVEGTGRLSAATGGRPAELFRFREDVHGERPRPGVPLPRP